MDGFGTTGWWTGSERQGGGWVRNDRLVDGFGITELRGLLSCNILDARFLAVGSGWLCGDFRFLTSFRNDKVVDGFGATGWWMGSERQGGGRVRNDGVLGTWFGITELTGLLLCNILDARFLAVGSGWLCGDFRFLTSFRNDKVVDGFGATGWWMGSERQGGGPVRNDGVLGTWFGITELRGLLLCNILDARFLAVGSGWLCGDFRFLTSFRNDKVVDGFGTTGWWTGSE